jgi:signal transduction histidine kinase
MKRILLFIFLFFALFGYSQNQQKIDSLKSLIRLEENTKHKVDLLNSLSIEFAATTIDSTIFFAKKALDLSKQINYKKGIALSHNYLSRALIEKSDFSSAIEHYNAALDLFYELKDSAMILDTYRGLSYVYSYSSNQMTSLNFNLRALEYAEQLKDTNSLSILFNNLAVSYLKIGDYSNSNIYFERTIEFDLMQNIPHNTAISYANQGVLFIRDQKLDRAAKSYEKVLELLPYVENNYVKSYLFISLLKFYSEDGQFITAKAYADSAYYLCNSYGFDHITVRLYRRLGELNIKQNNYSLAIKNLDSCLDLSSKLGVAEALPEVYMLKADALSKQGKHKEAYQAHEMSHIMQDSLKTSKIALVLGEYEEEQRTKNELKRRQLEQDLQNQRIENNRMEMLLKFRFAIAVIVLLVIVAISGFYFFFKLRKKTQLLKAQHDLINQQKEQLEQHNVLLKNSEENLQELNATKDKFFNIIAHDLKSPFTAIIGYSDELRENYQDYSEDERKLMIQNISKSSHLTFDLVENLLNWAQSQSGFIEINKEKLNLLQLVNNSIKPYKAAAKRKNIEVILKINDQFEINADKESMRIVISNLFNNAVKFSNEDSEIILSAKQSLKETIFCIQDFGLGMPKEMLKNLFRTDKNIQRVGTSNEKGTGLGLILCQEFIHKNDGKIWVESEEGKGSKFFFTLPLQSHLL